MIDQLFAHFEVITGMIALVLFFIATGVLVQKTQLSVADEYGVQPPTPPRGATPNHYHYRIYGRGIHATSLPEFQEHAERKTAEREAELEEYRALRKETRDRVKQRREARRAKLLEQAGDKLANRRRS